MNPYESIKTYKHHCTLVGMLVLDSIGSIPKDIPICTLASQADFIVTWQRFFAASSKDGDGRSSRTETWHTERERFAHTQIINNIYMYACMYCTPISDDIRFEITSLIFTSFFWGLPGSQAFVDQGGAMFDFRIISMTSLVKIAWH
jgi:hypothetical protein